MIRCIYLFFLELDALAHSLSSLALGHQRVATTVSDLSVLQRLSENIQVWHGFMVRKKEVIPSFCLENNFWLYQLRNYFLWSIVFFPCCVKNM
jgi:hypothetical protein